jgi:hypothetical protein
LQGALRQAAIKNFTTAGERTDFSRMPARTFCDFSGRVAYLLRNSIRDMAHSIN